jgi:RNA polymerase sigma-70 factor (ECF subfamily)
MQTLEAVPTRIDDDVLIRRTLKGNKEAFASLMGQHKDTLFDLAFRILRNRADAEDVLQDAFLDVYKHLKSFNHESRFSTWVYSIVLNRVRNHLRHGKVIRWTSLDGPASTNEDYKVPETPERGPSAQKVLEHKLDLAKVQKEVRLLPTLYQTIFIMHYFHQLSLEEVSRNLGRPLGTIKVYLHRARKLLYKRLTPLTLSMSGAA